MSRMVKPITNNELFDYGVNILYGLSCAHIINICDPEMYTV